MKKIIKENQSYRAIIKLEQSNKKKLFSPSQIFEESIYFIYSRNNFIFDFKFENRQSFFGNSITPPPSKKMSHLEQLKIYLKLVEDILKKEIHHKISLDLIEDCKSILIRGNYELDFFLEIFKFCYLFEPMKDLLILFKLEKIIIPPYPIAPNYYSECINYIEENPGFKSKFLSNEDKQEKYFKSFYTLLLYFRYNYEKDKIINLMYKEDFQVYYKEIIPFNYTIFKDLKIPQGLINEMTKQELLSTRIIEGIIYFLKSLEKILVFINEKNDCIFNLYMNKKKYIKINNLIDPNQTDYEEIISKERIEMILKETEKLVNYELQKKQFVFIEKNL